MNVDLNVEQKSKNYLFFKRCFFKTETIVFKLSVLKTLVFKKRYFFKKDRCDFRVFFVVQFSKNWKRSIPNYNYIHLKGHFFVLLKSIERGPIKLWSMKILM